jgi:nicotinamidase-related amidase
MSGFGEWRHVCVDMQRMFAEETPWRVPWMEKVSGQVIELSSRHRARSVFTRFMPPRSANETPGTWQDYYRKWEGMTLEHLPAELTNLIEPLARFVPPAVVFDKHTYSPWIDGRFHHHLQSQRVGTLAITGGETDVCVLATVLGGIDLGYKVILLEDAVCSGADETHDASLKLLGDRFSVQLDLMTTEAFLSRAANQHQRL